MPEILDRSPHVLSAWVTINARTILSMPGGTPQVFHSISQADYITVLALAPDGRVPLVRQFRPALERMTLELPGGLRDGSEDAASAASRELSEEVGLQPTAPLIQLGCLDPDTGRLENKFWCYFAPSTRFLPGWNPEPGVSIEWTSVEGLRRAVLEGRFDHALHVAVVGLAALRGLI